MSTAGQWVQAQQDPDPTTPSASNPRVVVAVQNAWAHAQQAPDGVPECSMTHDTEIRTAHQGSPTVAVQDQTHGAGSPPEDRG